MKQQQSKHVGTRIILRLVLVGIGLALGSRTVQAQVPASLLGRWRIQRVLPTQHQGCWEPDRAQALVGSILTYEPTRMVWQGGEIPLQGVLAVSRSLTRQNFLQEYAVSLDELGIRTPSVQEIDLQHEDADITGSTTEVPGDTVALAGPGRIVVSACGVFLEATRLRR